MANYLVQWEIDIEGASSPEDAAKQAWGHMRRPDSTANVFDVIDEAGEKVRVDLQDAGTAKDCGCICGSCSLGIHRCHSGKCSRNPENKLLGEKVRDDGNLLDFSNDRPREDE
jgi:hypothetical protein